MWTFKIKANLTVFSLKNRRAKTRALWIPFYFFFSKIPFSPFIEIPFIYISCSFYQCVQHKVFLTFFQKGFRLQVVFARIYTFPNDIMLTEFAVQLITWRIKVAGKRYSSVFWRFVVFFVDFAGFSGAQFVVLAGWECLWSEAQVVPHVSDTPRMFTTDKNAPLSPKNRNSVKYRRYSVFNIGKSHYSVHNSMIMGLIGPLFKLIWKPSTAILGKENSALKVKIYLCGRQEVDTTRAGSKKSDLLKVIIKHGRRTEGVGGGRRGERGSGGHYGKGTKQQLLVHQPESKNPTAT